MSETSPDQVQPDQEHTNVGQAMEEIGVDLNPEAAADFINDARTKIANGTASNIDRRMVEAHDADHAGQATDAAVQTEAEASPSPAPAAVESDPAVIPVAPPEAAAAEPVAEPAPEEPKKPVEDRTVEERTIVDGALGSAKRNIKDLESEITGKWGKEDTSALEADLESERSLVDYLKTEKTSTDPTQIRLNKAAPASEAEDTTPTAETPLLGEDGLVERLAKAMLDEDRTTREDVEDLILDRINANMKEDGSGISEEGAEALAEKIEKIAAKRVEELRQAATEAREAEAAAAAATLVEAEPATAETPKAATEGDGSTPEANKEDEEPTAPEAEALLEAAMDAVAVRYGQAKAAGEKTFSRKAQRSELDESSEALKQAFDQMIEASVETMHFTDETLQNAKEINAEVRESVLTQLNDLRQEKLNREGPYDHETDQELDDKIINLEAELNRCELSAESIQAELDGAPGLREEYIANRVMGLQKRISDTVTQERTRNHGKFAKVREWMQRHKGTRMLTSAGLTGLGIFGVVTANAPLYLSTNALKRGLTGYGSYEMTRSIGALKAGRNMSKAETDTIDSYLKASMRETTTMRRFNRASIIVGGALLTLGPTVFSVIDHYFHGGGTPASNGGGPRVINNGGGVRGGGGGAPRIIGSQPVNGGGGAATAVPAPTGNTAALASDTIPAPGAGAAVQIPSVSGNTLPWSFGMDTLHTNISDPSVLDHILNNQYGISFSGNGAGGGAGAFTSVTIPGQGTFTDPGHINGALEYILNNGGGSTV